MRRYGRTLQVKILRSVLLTVVVPAFLVLAAFYFAWHTYVRTRIAGDLARSTDAVAERIAADLVGYQGLLEELSRSAVVRAAFEGVGSPEDLSGVVQDVYQRMKDRRIRAVVSAVGSDGMGSFSTFGDRSVSAAGVEEPEWGLFGLMNGSPGTVVGYPRALRHGTALQTDYSLGVAVSGRSGRAIGYLLADLSFLEAQDPLPRSTGGIAGLLVLTDGVDRVVAAYHGNALQPFERFAIAGRSGEIEIVGIRYAYARAELGRQGLKAYGLASIESLVSSFRFGLYTIGLVLVLFSAVFSLILVRSVRRLTRPLRDTLAVVQKVSRGDFTARLEVISGDEFEEIAVRLNSLIVEMESTVKRLMERIEQAKTAEMKQLQAQFNPHFLYNTLDTAKWMMKMGEADKASAVLTSLAKVLRYSIHDRPAEPMVAIEEDLAAIKTYLEIHRLCMGDKLEVACRLDEAVARCRLPKLLIQPLVENALVHGIAPVGRGKIDISIRGQDGRVVIEVADDGKGFAVDPAALLKATAERSEPEPSIGLDLVLRRARLYFGEAFAFEIRSGPDQGSVVTLSFPKAPEGVPCSR
jgi:two-component system, sensor histidine kinase YesM